MNIYDVKNNLLKVNKSIIKLDRSIYELIVLLRNTDGSNCIKVTSYIPIISNQLKETMLNIDDMYDVNRLELPNLFSELNTKTIGIRTQATLLKKDLEKIKDKSYDIYAIYKFYEELGFLGDERLRIMLLDTSKIKVYIPSLERISRDLVKFRYSILLNNDKLVIGVRR